MTWRDEILSLVEDGYNEANGDRVNFLLACTMTGIMDVTEMFVQDPAARWAKLRECIELTKQGIRGKT